MSLIPANRPQSSKSLGFRFFVLRVLIGVFFVVISVDKLFEPYQNFLYAVQAYSIFPAILEEIVARVFPWVELFLGLFLILGLWLKWTLRSFLVMVFLFILIISQALVRGLALDTCGCFGGLFSAEIHQTLIVDFSLLLFFVMLLRRIEEASFWSLDQYFSKSEE